MKKICKTAALEARKLAEAPPGTAVKVLAEGEGWYEYEWVDGQPATSARDVWQFMNDRVWDSGAKPKLHIDVDSYCDYMEKIHYVSGAVTREIRRNVDLLTPVRYCHGDLTLENVIKTRNGEFVMVDPGNCRGMPCQELDEAKLMMSLDGWEFVKNGRVADLRKRLPFFPRKLHYALLATHYLRAAAHEEKHDWQALLFCRRRYHEILEILK